MLPVLETFKEALSVWVRMFRYLVILNLAFLPPDILFHTLKAYRISVSSSFWGPPLGFSLDFLQLLFDMASVAALFGLLKGGALNPWKLVWGSIKNYTLRLLWMVILTTLICAVPSIGIYVLVKHVVDSASAEVLLNVIFYLVFFVWVFGTPLVITENLSAKVALKRSFEMIKSNPLYFLGCLLFPCILEWSVRRILGLPIEVAEKEASWIWIMNDFILGIAGSAWGILIWTMSLRIKVTPGQSGSKVTLSSPESPSASQNA